MSEVQSENRRISVMLIKEYYTDTGNGGNSTSHVVANAVANLDKVIHSDK